MKPSDDVVPGLLHAVAVHDHVDKVGLSYLTCQGRNEYADLAGSSSAVVTDTSRRSSVQGGTHL
jgi:hypothetical protein